MPNIEISASRNPIDLRPKNINSLKLDPLESLTLAIPGLTPPREF